MNRNDFLKLTGADDSTDAVPVAFMTKSGYACTGHFSKELNSDLEGTCVVLNALLVEMKEVANSKRPIIDDFAEFLREVVLKSRDDETDPVDNEYGHPVPLTAIPFDEIAVLYPVSHINELIERAHSDKKQTPDMYDFSKSEILALLKTKLW